MRPSLLPSALALLLALPAAAGAQSRGGTTRDTVPVTMLPPAGKCRIWMVGVPATQQPAATDCATALRQKPTNGVVLYGPAQRDAGAERFDPKIGQEPRGTRATAERSNGSAGEQELERRREAAERARLIQEMRERDERARRDAAERATVMSSGTRANVQGGTANPPSPEGRTAQPRERSGNSTGSGGRPPADPKPPSDAKKKPE